MTRRQQRFIIGAVALAVAAVVPSAWHRPTHLMVDAKAQAAVPLTPIVPETIRPIWHISTHGYRCAALSPDGKYVALISHYTPGLQTEKLSLYKWQSHPNAPIWTRAEPNASLVAVGADAITLMTCAHMNPTERMVSFRRGIDGARITQSKVDGPIWSVTTSPNGQYAALTTGAPFGSGSDSAGRGLYLFSLSDRPAINRFPTLPGIGNSVGLASTNTYVAAGTWDESAVVCYTMNQTKVWQYPRESDVQAKQALANRVFTVDMAQMGHFVLGVSYANAHHSDGTLYLWRTDGDGTPLWTHKLGVGTSFPKALVTKNANFVAVSYTQQITHGDQTISEQRLLVLDHDGKLLWEKGNLLFSPTLLGVAPDGHRVTVSDGQKNLCNLDSDGRVTKILPIKSAQTILDTTTTPNGRFMLVHTSDGSLNLYQIG